MRVKAIGRRFREINSGEGWCVGLMILTNYSRTPRLATCSLWKPSPDRRVFYDTRDRARAERDYLQEAAALGKSFFAGIQDLRGLLWAEIDPKEFGPFKLPAIRDLMQKKGGVIR